MTRGDSLGAERGNSDKYTRPSGGDEERDTLGSLTPGAAGWLAGWRWLSPRRLDVSQALSHLFRVCCDGEETCHSSLPTSGLVWARLDMVGPGREGWE